MMTESSRRRSALLVAGLALTVALAALLSVDLWSGGAAPAGQEVGPQGDGSQAIPGPRQAGDPQQRTAEAVARTLVVVAADGAPAVGATVRLTRLSSGFAGSYSCASPVEVSTAKGDGSVSLPAGDLAVEARLDGHAVWRALVTSLTPDIQALLQVCAVVEVDASGCPPGNVGAAVVLMDCDAWGVGWQGRVAGGTRDWHAVGELIHEEGASVRVSRVSSGLVAWDDPFPRLSIEGGESQRIDVPAHQGFRVGVTGRYGAQVTPAHESLGHESVDSSGRLARGLSGCLSLRSGQTHQIVLDPALDCGVTGVFPSDGDEGSAHIRVYRESLLVNPKEGADGRRTLGLLSEGRATAGNEHGGFEVLGLMPGSKRYNAHWSSGEGASFHRSFGFVNLEQGQVVDLGVLQPTPGYKYEITVQGLLPDGHRFDLPADTEFWVKYSGGPKGDYTAAASVEIERCRLASGGVVLHGLPLGPNLIQIRPLGGWPVVGKKRPSSAAGRSKYHSSTTDSDMKWVAEIPYVESEETEFLVPLSCVEWDDRRSWGGAVTVLDKDAGQVVAAQLYMAPDRDPEARPGHSLRGSLSLEAGNYAAFGVLVNHDGAALVLRADGFSGGTAVVLNEVPSAPLRGVLIGKDGLPAAGAVVSCTPQRLVDLATRKNAAWLYTCKTDDEGGFLFSALPEGEGLVFRDSASIAVPGVDEELIVRVD